VTLAGRLLSLGNAHHTDAVGTHPGHVATTGVVDYAGSQEAMITWTGGNDVTRTTTVRDLEQAMKRHLPVSALGDERRPARRPRWTPYHVTGSCQVTSPLLPASDLLRTLHDAAVRRHQRGVICSSVAVDGHY